MSIDDKPYPGHPATTRIDKNIENICELVLTECRQSIINQLLEIRGLSWSSVQQILV